MLIELLNLSAWTVKNQRNWGKGWCEIRLHEWNMYLVIENDPFAVCNSPLPNVQQVINAFRTPTMKSVEKSMLPEDSRPQYWCNRISSWPHAFSNGLIDTDRPVCIENGMLTKLTAVSPDPMNLLMQITFAITWGQPLRMNAFSISFVLLHRKDLNLWDYNLIGVNQQNRRRTFSNYYNKVKINNFIIQLIECV